MLMTYDDDEPRVLVAFFAFASFCLCNSTLALYNSSLYNVRYSGLKFFIACSAADLSVVAKFTILFKSAYNPEGYLLLLKRLTNGLDAISSRSCSSVISLFPGAGAMLPSIAAAVATIIIIRPVVVSKGVTVDVRKNRNKEELLVIIFVAFTVILCVCMCVTRSWRRMVGWSFVVNVM